MKVASAIFPTSSSNLGFLIIPTNLAGEDELPEEARVANARQQKKIKLAAIKSALAVSTSAQDNHVDCAAGRRLLVGSDCLSMWRSFLLLRFLLYGQKKMKN